MKNSLILVYGLLLLGACQLSAPAQEATDTDVTTLQSQVFGWPFLSPETLQTRGGTTQGSEVLLQAGQSASWDALQEPGLTALERDRRAILAMQGAYRTSFQFIETAGFTEHYYPARPYFSWGTEYIHVLEDSGDFISLQHTMVMYFQNADGSVSEPAVMKHWRQDWQFEDASHHRYTGSNTWERQKVNADDRAGSWSQWVYQVDDSPRYQATGRWQHGLQYSSWQSDAAPRPLPRRESSARKDYNLLQSRHALTITPSGWLHEQSNQKVDRQQGVDRYLAKEIGINRYELLAQPELQAPAMAYWEATGDYWQAVRDEWRRLFAENAILGVKDSYGDKPLFSYHFEYAAKLEQGLEADADVQGAQARKTIANFLRVVE